MVNMRTAIAFRLHILVLVAATLLAGCAFPQRVTPQVVTPTVPPATPSPAAQVFTPTATALSFPSPTPTLTPSPTSDPLVLQATVEASLERVRLEAGAARIVCLRHEDLNADGTPEWLVLTHSAGAGSGRLDAFVLDGTQAYVLLPTPPESGKPDIGFGQAATCEVTLRDINADGAPEIAIFGQAAGNKTLMHFFTWDGAGYRRLGFFSGDGGVRFSGTDGDLEEEIWEGHRVGSAPDLVWYVVHTWRDGAYGWTSEHYDWYFSDRPQTYPTHNAETAVIAFYLALNDRDLPGAYNLLWADARPGYGEWALGYATTLQVRVGGVHLIPGTAGEQRARVAAMVTAWDNDAGVILARIWNVEWDVVQSSAGWRLLGSSAELLEEWVVPFWSD